MDFSLLSPSQLSYLLDVESMGAWTSADGASALEQQLLTPLLPDFAAVPTVNHACLMNSGGRTSAPLRLLDHLLSESPNPQILACIKEFGRYARDDKDSPLAGGPGTVLYYAAIAAALLHGQARLTSLDTGTLTDGFKWSRAQSGAGALCGLFSEAITRLHV